MLKHNLRRSKKAAEGQPGKPAGFRFGLRSLFVLLAAAGVVSAVLRSLVNGDATMFLGIGAFCYGGIVAICVYAFVGSLIVLSTTTTRGQRAGEIFAAAISAAAWIGFICAALYRWPQLCVVQSIVVVGIIGWLVRMNWKIEDGPSPEGMLGRLREAKRACGGRGQQNTRGPNDE
jgi:hypothetical protein